MTLPAVPNDRYSREHKLEHNQIARALVEQFPAFSSEYLESMDKTASANPKGGKHDDLSVKLYAAYEEEQKALEALKAAVLRADPPARLQELARNAESLQRATQSYKREFEARRKRRTPRTYEETFFTITLDGVEQYFEVDFEFNREDDRLEITNMDTLEKRGNSAPHTPCWVQLARWVQRMTENEDGRLESVDPDEYIWFDNDGYLRPRAYIVQQYPYLFRALEVIRRGLLNVEPVKRQFWWMDEVAT